MFLVDIEKQIQLRSEQHVQRLQSRSLQVAQRHLHQVFTESFESIK